jgi:hypothetical protein
MGRYRIELATEADDADLRHVLAATPMPGRVAVSFRREPSYFAAAAVDGCSRQVVAGRDLDSGRLVGFGSRSIRRAFVNGRPAAVGYLSGLRLLPAHRNGSLIARGYAYFKRLHGDGRAPVYLTTIAEGNDRALDLLTSGRAGLPAYHPAGCYVTLALPLRRRAARPGRDLDIQQATAADVPEMLGFLNAIGPARQFFPCYEAADFFEPGGALHGLTPSDLLLARRDGRLVGTLGAWDQSAFRQTVVDGYQGTLRWLRPLVNGAAWLRGLPRLPNPGQPLRNVFAALPVVTDNDPAALAALLETLLGRVTGSDYLLFGALEQDPLLAVARRYAAVAYVTRLFVVCWDDGEAYRRGLDGRTPYLELGSL